MTSLAWCSATSAHSGASVGGNDRRQREHAVIEEPQSDPQAVGPDRSGLAARRVAVGAVSGIVVAVIALVEGASWSVAALGATDAAALVFVVWVWVSIAGADADETGRRARAEDASRTAAEAVLLGAGAASLIAVGFTLAQASHTAAPGRGLLTGLALVSVALAWTAVHTVYALRYARLYYSRENRTTPLASPTRTDIGMTFQARPTLAPPRKPHRLTSTCRPSPHLLLRRSRQRREFVGGAWAAQEVALCPVAAIFREHVQRDIVLDTFGDHGEAEIVRQLDRRAHDHRVVILIPAVGQPGDERLVDLDLVDRQSLR